MTRKRILLVEDHVLIAEEVEQQLTKLGYEVVGTIDTGEDAISMAEVLSPDLVLLDVQLRGKMDGFEAGRLIQQSVGCAITYMTASVLGNGVNSCLRKPFSPAALARSVGTALANR